MYNMHTKAIIVDDTANTIIAATVPSLFVNIKWNDCRDASNHAKPQLKAMLAINNWHKRSYAMQQYTYIN